MKILFVVGGSYKAFYINNLKKIKNLDLLIFQENILYEFDYYNELCGNKLITNEMMSLVLKLNCKIIAKIRTNLCGIIKNEMLYADKNGVKIIDENRYLKFLFKNKAVICSFHTIIYDKYDLQIILKNSRVNQHIKKIYVKNKMLICDKYGVVYSNKDKIVRKFWKICYFSLKM